MASWQASTRLQERASTRMIRIWYVTDFLRYFGGVFFLSAHWMFLLLPGVDAELDGIATVFATNGIYDV